VRNSIGKLLLGNSLGQIIQFSSILIFSRLYTPVEFGVLGQVQSCATVAAILCTLQMHLSIPLCKDTPEAKSLVSTIVAVCYAFALIALPFALFSGRVYVYSLFLALFVGLSNTFNGYFVFGGSFGSISRFYVFRSIAIVAVQAALGIANVSDGLVWGALGGEGITAAYLAVVTKNSILPMSRSYSRIAQVVNELQSFALFGTLQELASVSAFYAPLFFFARAYDASVVGQYAMASRLVWAPVILFSGSLAQVLYHEFGKDRSGKQMRLGFLKLPHIGYYPLLLAAPVACYLLRDVVLVALGAKWRGAADMLPLVVAWGAVFVVSTPSRVVCRMLRQQKIHLAIDLAMLGGIALVFLVAGRSPLQAMLGILAVAVVQNLLMIVTAWGAITKSAPLKRELA
jgi:O-antigen/teichoic acid export membrane protein